MSIAIDPDSALTAQVGLASTLAGNVTVQISAMLPSTHSYVAASLNGLSPTSNPYAEELFNWSGPAVSAISGNLLPQFYPVDSAWLATIGPLTTSISLQLSATLNVVRNGSVQVYTYTNNIPFNPRAPPASFSAAVSFAPTPTFTVPLPPTSSTAASFSPAHPIPNPCTPGYYWYPVNTTVLDNITFPLVMVDVAGSPSGSEVAYSLHYDTGTFEVSFNSATGYSTSSSTLSGLQMSTNASGSATQTNFQEVTEDAAANTFSGGHPVTMIGLADVNMGVLNYRYDYLNEYCEPISYTDEYQTILNPLGLSGSSFTFLKAAMPTWFPQFMSSESDWGTIPPPISLPYPSGQFNLYQVMSNATGYSNANSTLHGVVDFLTSLSMNLGIAAAASAALGFIPGSGDASAAACLAAIAAITGYIAGFATLMSSISYSTSVHYAIEGYGVGNSPGAEYQGTLSGSVWEDSVSTSLQVSGQNLEPLMPMVYVSVA